MEVNNNAALDLEQEEEILTRRRTDMNYLNQVETIRLRKRYMDAVEGAYELTRKEGVPEVLIDYYKGRKALVIKLFDVHFGEYVTEDKKVIYDFNLGHQYMTGIFNHAMEIIMNTGLHLFREVVVVLGGDLIEGDGSVFPGQKNHLEAGFPEQIEQITISLIDNIYKLSQFLGTNRRIRMIGVPGNHGLNKFAKGIFHEIKDNYDTCVYYSLSRQIRLAQSRYNDLLNVSIEFPLEQGYEVFKIFDFGCIAFHKSKKNPASPTGVLETLAWMFNEGKHNIRLIFSGHWHDGKMTPVGNAFHIRSGCFPGPNSYSKGLAIPNNDPQELILVIDEETCLESLIVHNFKAYNERQQSGSGS